MLPVCQIGFFIFKQRYRHLADINWIANEFAEAGTATIFTGSYLEKQLISTSDEQIFVIYVGLLN